MPIERRGEGAISFSGRIFWSSTPLGCNAQNQQLSNWFKSQIVPTLRYVQYSNLQHPYQHIPMPGTGCLCVLDPRHTERLPRLPIPDISRNMITPENCRTNGGLTERFMLSIISGRCVASWLSSCSFTSAARVAAASSVVLPPPTPRCFGACLHTSSVVEVTNNSASKPRR